MSTTAQPPDTPCPRCGYDLSDATINHAPIRSLDGRCLRLPKHDGTPQENYARVQCQPPDTRPCARCHQPITIQPQLCPVGHPEGCAVQYYCSPDWPTTVDPRDELIARIWVALVRWKAPHIRAADEAIRVIGEINLLIEQYLYGDIRAIIERETGK